MAGNNYSFQGMKEDMARAMRKDAEVSPKVAIEMCLFLKGRTTSDAKKVLERVLAMKQAVPFRRFTDGVGHRKGAGIAAGRYPQKASGVFTELIESVEANAQAKGLSSSLKIVHLAVQRPSVTRHYGRHRGQAKRANVEIVVQETGKDSKMGAGAAGKAAPRTEEKKIEEKKEGKQEEKQGMKQGISEEKERKEEKKEEKKEESGIKEAKESKAETGRKAPAQKKQEKQEKPEAKAPAKHGEAQHTGKSYRKPAKE
jgi:large subunit ribosomal protein L22